MNPKIYREDFAKRLIELAGGEDGMELHDDGVYLTKEWVEETEEIKNKITAEILTEGKSYQEALEDGRKDLLEYLMR